MMTHAPLSTIMRIIFKLAPVKRTAGPRRTGIAVGGQAYRELLITCSDRDSLFPRGQPQVGNNSAPLVRAFHMEGHVGIRHQLVGIREPLVQRLLRPPKVGFLERVGVLERRDGRGRPSVHSAETRTFLVPVKRVAATTTLVKQFLAMFVSGLRLTCCG